MSDDPDFEDRYDELRAEYLERVEHRMEAIEEWIDALRDEFDAETFDELRRVVHRLAGSGETMGFPRISELSIELEGRLDEVEPEGVEHSLDWIARYVEEIREMLDES